LVKSIFLLSKPGSFDPKTILIAAGNPAANTHTNLPLLVAETNMFIPQKAVSIGKESVASHIKPRPDTSCG
jgi:hypothetical protein